MDWSDLGLVFVFGGAGLYASVKIMTTEQKTWKWLGLVLMAIGLGMVVYGLVVRV